MSALKLKVSFTSRTQTPTAINNATPTLAAAGTRVDSLMHAVTFGKSPRRPNANVALTSITSDNALLLTNLLANAT